jgi:hypothetical protein
MEAFLALKGFIISTKTIPLNDAMSDDEAFMICLKERYERHPVFKILLVSSIDEEERILTAWDDIAIDWDKVKKGILVCQYGDTLKRVYADYARALLRLETEPISI